MAVPASFDNTAISNDSDPSAADIINGRSYSAQALTAAGVTPGGTVSYDGTSFTWPDVPAGTPDNVEADRVRQAGPGVQLPVTGTSPAAGMHIFGIAVS